MSSPNKHKPFNPEELLEWLDKKSNKENTSSFSDSEFDNLDEFERDAIEGFENHSSPEKAKALIDEINLEISNKVQVKGPAKKNRIIWFSAAASLVLVITLSIFLINKTQKETESNIALNDVSSEDSGKDELVVEQENKPVETSTSEIKEEGKDAQPVKTLEGTKQMPLEKLAEENTIVQAKDVNANVASGSTTNGTILSSVSENQFGLAKNNDNANITGKADGDIAVDVKTSMPVMQDLETKKRVKEEVDKAVSDEVAATETSVAKAEIVMNEKSNNDSKFKERKAAKKPSVTKSPDASAGYIQNTTTATVPGGYITNEVYNVAYYEGNEIAIKKYVLDYLKNKSVSQIMKGSFKINGTVDEKGKLIVVSVTSINNECKDCESILKNALNVMPDWKPALQSGKAVSSKTSFALNF